MDFRDTEGKPKEACGVFGLYSRELAGELAQRTYFGLYALQHRGQESAGIAVSDGERTTAMRDMGLVSQVFDGTSLAALEAGHLALGHVRYSTTGSASWENAPSPSWEAPPAGERCGRACSGDASASP